MTNGEAIWSYTYDANGMRTQRSTGTTAYNYVYNGGSLSQMTVGNNTLNFAYDASGIPMMVTYNGTNYYYIVNLQGDVMGIVNANGTLVVSYTYDAWGKPLSITGSMADTLGTLNPLRYRGYVYDTETGYYYLQSRYYDPKNGRFINADTLVSTGQGLLGNNMFAYCLNNPVNYIDLDGNYSIWFYLMLYSDWGFIHRQVQAHILATSPLAGDLRKEVYLRNGRRADIINTNTGEVWEVKHGAHNIPAAKSQVEQYVGQYPLMGGEELVCGGAEVFSGEFYVSYGEANYLVSYSTPEPGVIIYEIENQPSPQMKPLLNYAFSPKTQPKFSEQTATRGMSMGAVVALAGVTFGLALLCLTSRLCR